MPRNNLQRNADYWAQRMKNMEDALLDQSYSYVENLDAQFRAAEAEIERQMSAWYRRFAANNDITLADAKRLLNSDELAEFRWTVEEYIKHGEENALTGAWMKELENASARVHISRLDALKIQLQQQAELLYSNQLDYIDRAARQSYTGSFYHTAYEVQKGLGVGWTMQAVNEGTITKVLSRPWTTDGQTFRDRCWTNKQSLVNSVNTQLTQMIIRGEAPDRAISAISKQFEVSRSKAGRLVMTESAYFSSAAQKDCFNALGVEKYRIVASFDRDTCGLCSALDGKVFKMSDYQVGLTAPPFHPWCRCCTAPYFEDMEGLGERWTRNPDGTTKKVPANTTFEEWRGQFVRAEIEEPVQMPTQSRRRFRDIIGKWYPDAKPNSHMVQDLQQYEANGVTYMVDGHSVVLDHSAHEKEIAELLEREIGGELFMVPRVNSPQGVSTPDYLFHGIAYDLKTIGSNAGPNTIFNRVKKAGRQAQNFIVDVTNSGLDDEIIEKQIEKLFTRSDTEWVDELVIVRNGKIVRVVKRA